MSRPTPLHQAFSSRDERAQALVRRAIGTVLLLAATLPACDRVKEPQGVPAVSAVSAGPAAGAGSPATPRPRPCRVELPATPPPRAEKAAACPEDPGPVPPAFARGDVRFPEAPGRPAVAVEVARTRAEHARGLMYRTGLPDSSGMLFAWDDEDARVFWMKNTCIPLDMLFLARDGTVLGVVEEVAVLSDAPKTVPCPAAYVLEVNAGWTRKHGVRPGMKAELSL